MKRSKHTVLGFFPNYLYNFHYTQIRKKSIKNFLKEWRIILMKIESLTTDTFNETIESATNTIIIDFYADWCVPCKMITPILEEFAAEKGDAVSIYKVNIDENPELASQFSVMTIPNLISFKDGKLYKTVIGVQPKSAIQDLME